MAVTPVALPVAPHHKRKNNHLGWPVGIKVGRTLLCVYHQTQCHHGGNRFAADSSDAVVVRSTDGGKTWSEPIDIRQFGTSKKAKFPGRTAVNYCT